MPSRPQGAEIFKLFWALAFSRLILINILLQIVELFCVGLTGAEVSADAAEKKRRHTQRINDIQILNNWCILFYISGWSQSTRSDWDWERGSDVTDCNRNGQPITNRLPQLLRKEAQVRPQHLSTLLKRIQQAWQTTQKGRLNDIGLLV